MADPANDQPAGTRRDVGIWGAAFLALAAHIDTFGYESEFYSTRQIYYDHAGDTYWHMGNIINRCPASETYTRRKAEGRLPEDLR